MVHKGNVLYIYPIVYRLSMCTIYDICHIPRWGLQSTELSSCETTEDGRLAESSDLRYRQILEAATDLRFVR